MHIYIIILFIYLFLMHSFYFSSRFWILVLAVYFKRRIKQTNQYVWFSTTYLHYEPYVCEWVAKGTLPIGIWRSFNWTTTIQPMSQEKELSLHVTGANRRTGCVGLLSFIWIQLYNNWLCLHAPLFFFFN
jgi:hypothetical protein